MDKEKWVLRLWDKTVFPIMESTVRLTWIMFVICAQGAVAAWLFTGFLFFAMYKTDMLGLPMDAFAGQEFVSGVFYFFWVGYWLVRSMVLLAKHTGE